MILRAPTPADAGELRRIHETPEVARWWGVPGAGFPDEDATATRFVIEADGAVAGMVQFFEEPDPDYRHAMIDLFVDPALHGRGLGTEALRRAVELLVTERGHHRITIDPAADNAAAIRTYEKAGFRPVGVLHRYERDQLRDGWHDCLLMELLADTA
ncbi:MAG TPA: GNAT family protein [Solirubrobacteraceae bacterium]|jgi:aminoglycoside 6'-N-acetyltransferase|nr:GNAT family protein [Solirubrobacteraceae bacterium]